MNQLSFINDEDLVESSTQTVASVQDDRIKALSAFMQIPYEAASKVTLSDLAFCYTAGRSGHNSGIRFMMSREDAMTWCSSDVSHGVLHGSPWAYMWTSVENYCFCHWGQLKGVLIDMHRLEDNGQWDDKILALNLKKYDRTAIQQILGCFGIEVKW